MLFKFSPAVALIGVLATLALANPEPQTPAQTSQAIADLSSYAAALQTDPAVMSLASELATNTGLASSFVDAFQSIYNDALNGQTANIGVLSAFPTQVQSLLGSVVTAEASIFSKDGFTSQAAAAVGTGTTSAGTATTTKSGNAGPTAAAVGLSAAALGGLVGVVMAL